MTMTAEEIVREYKAAKYPEKQIRILADENSCGVSNIKTILEQAGCELPRAGRKKKTLPPESGGAIAKFSLETKDFEKGDESMKENAAPLTVLPAPEGAGEFQDEGPAPVAAPEPIPEPASEAPTGKIVYIPEDPPAPPHDEDDDTVSASEVLPLMLRTSAIDVIARLLKDTRNSPESGQRFTEQVRGVLALIHEVESRAAEVGS